MTADLCQTDFASGACEDIPLRKPTPAAYGVDCAAYGVDCAAYGVDDAALVGLLQNWSEPVAWEDFTSRVAAALAQSSARLVAVCEIPADLQAPTRLQTLWEMESGLLETWRCAILNAARQVTLHKPLHIHECRIGRPEQLVVLAVPGEVEPGAHMAVIALFDRVESIVPSTLHTLVSVTLRLSVWRAMSGRAQQDLAARKMAALADLLGRIQSADTPAMACRLLANELQVYLGCQQVVVGLCRDASMRCRVEAVSGVDTIDPRAEKTRLAQAALQEAIARGTMSVWPPREADSVFALKAHERYALATAAGFVCGSPLRDASGDVRGAWLLTGASTPARQDEAIAFLGSAASPVASTLSLQARAQPGPIAGSYKWCVNSLRRRRGRAVLAATLLALASLLLPVPHRVKCDCQLEPITRRFVAAPFDGPLEETLVEPGDLVKAGQLLARMDGREVRWELAGVQAERYRAAKERAGHVAAHAAGAAEVARHEVDRLRYREQLLEARNQELDICSPVDGLVVSGDLKDAEGMPLQVGEVLFEVAPLDAMVVELAVPEDDLAYVAAGSAVVITFDAYPLHSYRASIETVHPRAELRDEQNVFVAEVRLENPQQILLPGMRGRARIEAGSEPLGWLLFHRPMVAAMEWLGW